MEVLIEKINSIVWGSAMLMLILGTGIYFTIRTKFFQIRKLKYICSNTIISIFKDKSVTQSKDKHSISQFQALSTSLAATMGTGNIVGVATALTIGGAGAIFWMWISAFFGMMTIFAENVLGSIYRDKTNNGSWNGGPMSYLEKGLKSKLLAVIFAICCTLASFGMGNLAQINSISDAVSQTIGVPAIATGLIVAVLVGVIIFGGIKRIGKITELIIPPLSLLYIVGSIIIIAINFRNIPLAFSEIFESAFGLSAIGGGISGYVIKMSINIGLRRGVFSNEAGLGSSVLLHSETNSKHPLTLGMWGIFEVFVDTMICCTLTAFVILTTNVLDTSLDGASLVISAFEKGFGEFAGVFITISIILFAFATLLGWSYCGARTFTYLFSEKHTAIYKFIFILVIIWGATAELSIAWGISDIFNGLMAIPNLTGVLLLSKKVFDEVKNAEK